MLQSSSHPSLVINNNNDSESVSTFDSLLLYIMKTR